MYSVGMIGAGIIGAKHVKAVCEHGKTKLVAVADLVISRANQAAASCNAHAYESYDEMLSKESLDIVIINLPHGLHEECALACAKRGIHILLEKPMSVTYASCLKIEKACNEHGSSLQIGHIQRYIPQNRAAYEIMQSGKLGRLAMINDLRTNNYFVQSRPRWFLNKKMAGGGISMNYAVHSIDKICYLTNSTISSITGGCTYFQSDTDVDGSAQMLIKTKNGVSASISLCGYAVVPVDETMLFFENGAIRLNTGSAVSVTYGGEYEKIDESGFQDAFTAQWADFIDGICAGRIINCDSTYGAQIIRAVEALY